MVSTEATTLPWDAFLALEAQRVGVRPEDRERWMAQHVKSLAAYREFEWPQVRAALAKDFGIRIPAEQEPHWTEGGSAVFWQRQVVKRPQVVRSTSDGTPVRELVDQDDGWRPTSPQPANNAWQIANALRRGLRLRPPEGDDEGEVFVPEAVAKAFPLHRQRPRVASYVDADSLKQPPLPEQPHPFVCERHGPGERFMFPTWKAYVQHCDNRLELPEGAPPKEVLERAAKYPYFCHQHLHGYPSRRLAERHLKIELSKPGRAVHLSLEQMKRKARSD